MLYNVFYFFIFFLVIFFFYFFLPFRTPPTVTCLPLSDTPWSVSTLRHFIIVTTYYIYQVVIAKKKKVNRVKLEPFAESERQKDRQSPTCGAVRPFASSPHFSCVCVAFPFPFVIRYALSIICYPLKIFN